MKTLEKVINTLIEKDIKNRIIYTGNCCKCGNFFYTYATNMPELCSKSCRFDNRHLTTDGYYGTYVNGKQQKEHRVIMSKYLGYAVDFDMEVHHINGNKLDNRIENLIILSKSDHAKLHANHNHA